MLDIALHAGTEHASMWLIAIPSILSFFAGLLLGVSSGTVRDHLLASRTES